jgi:hypothetical protein
MKIIAHRGNMNGPNSITENTPHQIDLCINRGYDVEVDLWYIDKKFYFGHDEPTYETNMSFLEDREDRLWIHCKNQKSFFKLNNSLFNYFWHQEDDLTLTSKGYIWAYPYKHEKLHQKLVVLNFSQNVDFLYYKNSNIYGICVDYIN